MKKNVYSIHAFLTFNLIIFTILSGLVLTSTYVSAENNEVIDTMELTVPVACTMGGVGNNSHNATLNPGTYSGATGNEYENGIGKTTLTSFCNDNNGFSIYAIGFTDNLYEGESHTKLIGQNTNQTINTKVYGSGDTDSNWSMKVTKVDNPASGDPITYNPNNMTVANSFNSWHEVPDTYTKVAEYHANTGPSTTDTTLGAKLETTYAAYISNTQSADTYTGQVKYTMVHPYDRRAPEAPYFQVFYTGRPASTEPGHENPVKIRMSDLPADGKYNLLGTADGLYDKLTPDTLYGGYYKNIVDSVEDFSYTNEAEYYDGTNFNWLISTPETTDAAAITPENETTYYVKEVNSTRYIRMGTRWTFGGDDIKGFWFFTDLDDENYAYAGFYYSDNTVTGRIYLATGLFGSYTITPLENPANAKAHTAESLFKAYGENNVVAPWQDNQNEVLNDEVESFTAHGFWITKDGYEVTGRRQLNVTTNGWHNSTISSSYEGIPSTISKWNPIE